MGADDRHEPDHADDAYERLLAEADDHYRAGRYADAADALARAGDLRPDDPERLLRLAVVKECQGSDRAAEDVYARVARIAPGDPRAHLGLAGLYHARGETEPRDDALRAAARVGEDSPERHQALGHLAAYHDRHDDALRHFEDARARRAGDDPDLDMLTGHALLSLKRHAEAAPLLRRTAAENGDAHTLHLLGIAEQRLHRYPEARAAYAEAVAADPGYYQGYLALSAVEFRMGRLRDAWRHFRDAWRVAPER